MKKLELKIPPLIVTIVFGGLIWIMPDIYKIKVGKPLIGLSVFLLSLGIIVSILGVFEFRKKKTTVNPMTPQNSNSLVVEGIYTYTRNPMYLGFLLWLFALGIFLGKPISLIHIALFILYMNFFQIGPEEQVLTEKYGKDFLKFKKTVRRWI